MNVLSEIGHPDCSNADVNDETVSFSHFMQFSNCNKKNQVW